MNRSFFSPTLIIATLAIIILILTTFPRTSTATVLLPFLTPDEERVYPTTADTQNVELISQIGGATYAVAVQGNYSYIGVGPRLVVLDISNPTNPTVVGQTGVWPNLVEDVYVVGNYAYVAAGYGGLRVVNVSTPAVPVEVGAYTTPGPAHSIYVAGGYVYVADMYSLWVIDVSNPAAPMEVGFYYTPGCCAYDVYVASNYAYIAAGYYGLRVVDVSNPRGPVEMGTYDTSWDAYDVYVAGDYAYVAAGSSGLRVIDVSNPRAPAEAGFYTPGCCAGGVYIAGEYAYVAAAYSGLRVIDVSNPAALVEVGFYDTPGYAEGVYVVGGYTYIADRWHGLRVIDVSNPTAPWEVGTHSTIGSARDVYIAGDYGYVADANGVRVVDLSNLAAPAEVGAYDAPFYSAYGIYVVGTYAYVTNAGFGLRVVDVSNPAAPREVGVYDTPGWASGIFVVGGYAYVADGGSGLRVVDVSNPAALMEVGFYDTPDWASDVYVAGAYAYVADGESGLQVIDVSNPAALVGVGAYNTPGEAGSVYVAGPYAYVTDGLAGLRVIDVSNPAALREVGSYNTPGCCAVSVHVAGPYAYVAAGDAGLRVVDVSDSTALREVGAYNTPSNVHGYYGALGVYITGSYAYVAYDEGGLFILRFTGRGPRAKPPVVLVHGWMGLPVSGNTGNACTNIPTWVYPGTNRFFGDLPQWLYDLGYTEIYEVNLTTRPGYTPLFESNGECLRRQLESVTSGGRKAILIAHSMGGLVSRAYMEGSDYRGDIAHLITVGSPHTGINTVFLLKILLGHKSPAAIAAYCLADPGTCQLTTEQVALFNLTHSSRAPGVLYSFAGGRKTPFPWGWLLLPLDGPNDGAVGLFSATGRLWPVGLKVVDGPHVDRYQTDETHSPGFGLGEPTYFEGEASQTRSCMGYLLGGSGGSCSEVTAVAAAAPLQLPAPATAYTPDARGHITSSQTVTHSLQVDADGASLFYLSWVTGTLGLTLTNPVGTVIDPAYAAANPDMVTHATSPGSEMTPPFASYAFTTTVPGLYTATITAGNAGITGTDYLLFAAMETTRTLSVALDSDHYQIGDTAVLTATLEGAGGGIAGATVQATLSRSDGIADTLSLTDQGDGTYRGAYIIPNAPGYLHLRITAEGSDAGTQFSRQVDRLLTVASQAVQLTGIYGDRAEDADGNGRYEALIVDVEVLAAGAGDFTFSANLFGGGQFVAHVITPTTLITGTQSVPLRFDGELIRDAGSDGPFTVTNLLIGDMQNVGIPSVMADDVWTTAGYDHTRFGRIIGDLNGDCVVDVTDIQIMIPRWLTRIGDPSYDVTYDRDRDGDIDALDIMLVAARWANTCD